MFRNICYVVVLLFFCAQAQAAVDITKNHDSTKPVEITADSLEVLQEENKAVFSGTVQAKQGDLDIRSEKMTVYYKKGAKNEENSANKISKVEIDDNVFISTEKETAQGDKGVYDVDKGLITLEGNVTLTSMKNIVKGNKLVYNLKTGQSKMVGGSVKNKGGKKERVKSVFVPGGK